MVIPPPVSSIGLVYEYFHNSTWASVVCCTLGNRQLAMHKMHQPSHSFRMVQWSQPLMETIDSKRRYEQK